MMRRLGRYVLARLLSDRSVRSVGSAFCLILLLSIGASAQRLIVLTTSLSLTHDPTRVCMQSVDMRVGKPLPGIETLPGTAATGALLLSGDGESVLLSTGTPPNASASEPGKTACFLSCLKTAPFQLASRVEFPSEWRESACGLLESPPGILALAEAAANEGRFRGRLEWYPLAREAAVDTAAGAFDLKGVPAAAAVLPGTDRVVMLCRGPLGTGVQFAIVRLSTKETVELRQASRDDDLAAATPSALVVTRDGGHVLVLTSGYALSPPSGESVSWLRVYDTEHFMPFGKAVMIPGISKPEEHPLTPCGDAGCWIVTRTPGTGLAYVTRIRVNTDQALVQTQVPLTGASTPVRLALEPNGDGIAVGLENRLELWREGRRGGPSESYQAPVGAVRWTPEGLFVAEAGCLHQVDTQSCASLKRVQLQTGWITDLAVIPAAQLPAPDPDADGLTNAEEIRLGTSASSPDTDGDGIPDGSDPEPLEPSPRLRLPDAVEFHEKAVGLEVKGIKIAPEYAEGYSWRLDYDRKQMPWFVIHPVSDKAPGVIYLGVDPGRYSPGKQTEGKVTVQLVKPGAKKAAAGSPASFDVRVLPAEGSGPRRILWIREQGSGDISFRTEADPYRLRALGDLLAAPPYHFTHREAIAPTQEDLDSYGVVVLGVAAAAQGALTRQAVLRYVLDGGAVLLLGGYLPREAHAELAGWLAPLGIQLDTNTRMEATANVNDLHPILRHVSVLAFGDGCAVTSDDRATVLVPAGPQGRQAALVAKTYGRGRIAVLASPSPLESAVLSKQSNRLFAADLFQWLTEGGSAQEQDMDSDGLPDSIEDKNGNGLVDPGETDYLDPDSDGDGVPDGVEDANHNGVVDDGETSPLNPDSNGNGIFDGADPAPLPSIGAPVVAQVSPPQAPGEGGGMALVSGRNFAPDAAFWFGARQSPQVRIMGSSDALVEIPASEAGEGDVPVRVVNASSGQEGTLPKGFHYTPRTRVPIVLQALKAVAVQKGMYEGAVSLRIEPPPDIVPDKVLLLLHAEPPDGFEWTEPEAASGSSERPVVYRRTQAGDLHIVMLGGKPGATPAYDVGPINWKYTAPETLTEHALHLTIEEPRVLAHNGQPLDAVVTNADVDLKTARE